MIDGSHNYETDSVKSLAKAYLQRIEKTEYLRIKAKEAENLYSQTRQFNEKLEKILANRIGDNCVIAQSSPSSNVKVLIAGKNTAIVGNNAYLIIKDAVK